MVRAHRLDHAVIIRGDEALDGDAEILLERGEELGARFQHRPRILGRDQPDADQLGLGPDQGRRRQQRSGGQRTFEYRATRGGHVILPR
jgi:hypothetical protein